MAILHRGAFAGSLHGSTKSSTFRRSKSGTVVYDRVDQHGITRGVTGTQSLQQARFFIANFLRQGLGPMPYLGANATKFGTKVNAYMRLLLNSVSTLAISNVASPFYEANTLAAAKAAAATAVASNTFAGNVSTFGSSNVAAIRNSMAVAGGSNIATYSVGTPTAASVPVTISVADGREHRVDVIAIDVQTGASFEVTQTISGFAPVEVGVAGTYTAIDLVSSPWYQETAVAVLVRVDGKVVSQTWGGLAGHANLSA